jgi:thiol:disulfide interchange protein DsbA
MFVRLVTAFALAVVATAISAQPNMVERFREGTHFAVIDPPQPTSATAGKIEVVEAFSYACPACAMFQPAINQWVARKPANVVFVSMPIAWSPPWEMVARAYFAAEALGIKADTHDAFFKALHVERLPLATPEDIAKWYAKTGKVSEADFLATMKSTGVTAKIARSKQAAPRLGIASTPTMIVAGRYRVLNDGVSSQEQIFEVVDFLVAREAARAATGG